MHTLPSGYGRFTIGALVGVVSVALLFEGLAGGASDRLPPTGDSAVNADPARGGPEPISPLYATTSGQPATTTVTGSSTTTVTSTTTTTITTHRPPSATTTTTRCGLVLC